MPQTTKSLFLPEPKSHSGDPHTSYDAADKAKKTRRWWHQKIYTVLRDYDRGIGQTAKEIAYRIDRYRWEKIYFDVQRRLKEMEDRVWIFRCKEGRESLVGGGKCCPWFAHFGKESEVFDVKDKCT